jgi:creatinine amidohydrolase
VTAENWPLFLRKMTSPQIGEAVKTARIALVAVGSIEQHGAHLPIDTDLSTVEYLAEEGLKKARQDASLPVALIAPAVPFGTTLQMDWPGHIYLSSSTLIRVLMEIGERLVKSGFRYVVFLNGCVGSINAVQVAVSDLKASIPDADFIMLGSTWAMPEAILRNSGPGGMGHACELETATQLVIDPEHVRMDLAQNEHMRHPSPDVSYDFDSIPPFYWPVHFADMTESGVIGDPSLATAENGRLILNKNVERVARILCHIHGLGEEKYRNG